MSERLSPWRSKPPQVVLDLLGSLAETLLFLVQRSGPLSFVVREDATDLKRRVSIGAKPTCTCMPSAPGQGCHELCRHLLFVMTKVLRVPPSNPLVWQLSLTDREVEEVLRCGSLPLHQPRQDAGQQPADKGKGNKKLPDDSSSCVARRPIDEEDPCPICYDDMCGLDLNQLVWCQSGCGRNVHGRCMGVWAEHQIKALGKELSCPLCRTPWGEFTWRPPPPKRRKPDAVHDQLGVSLHLGCSCGACKKMPLAGKRYKCLICANYDLCEGCFQHGSHPQHPFACKETPTSFAQPAHRAEMLPTAVRLGGPTGSEDSNAQGTANDAELTSRDHTPGGHAAKTVRRRLTSGSGTSQASSSESNDTVLGAANNVKQKPKACQGTRFRKPPRPPPSSEQLADILTMQGMSLQSAITATETADTPPPRLSSSESRSCNDTRNSPIKLPRQLLATPPMGCLSSDISHRPLTNAIGGRRKQLDPRAAAAAETRAMAALAVQDNPMQCILAQGVSLYANPDTNIPHTSGSKPSHPNKSGMGGLNGLTNQLSVRKGPPLTSHNRKPSKVDRPSVQHDVPPHDMLLAAVPMLPSERFSHSKAPSRRTPVSAEGSASTEPSRLRFVRRTASMPSGISSHDCYSAPSSAMDSWGDTELLISPSAR